MYTADNQEKMAREGAIDILVDLLYNSNELTLRQAAKALANLGTSNNMSIVLYVIVLSIANYYFFRTTAYALHVPLHVPYNLCMYISRLTYHPHICRCIV